MRLTSPEPGYIDKGDTARVTLFANELNIRSFEVEVTERFDVKIGSAVNLKIIGIERLVTERG